MRDRLNYARVDRESRTDKILAVTRYSRAFYRDIRVHLGVNAL